MKRQWLRVELSCGDTFADELAAMVAEEFGVGVEFTEEGIRFYLEEHYLPKDWEIALQRIIAGASAVWPYTGPVRYTLSTVVDEDWADRWKEHFKPLRVGEHFVIAPTWEEVVSSAGDRVIRINPGRAFGTGHHESTRLCLEWLESWAAAGSDLRDRSFLDMGTGSAILAMAGVLLGFGRVAGIDNDPEAIEVARENLSLNAMEDRVELKLGTAESITGKYDIILANIQARPLIGMAESLTGCLKPHGRLVLSGILLEQDKDVRAAYESKGFELVDRRAAGEWCLLEFKSLVR